MKIISKFHDYYDGLIQSDLDGKYVWNRKAESIPWKELNLSIGFLTFYDKTKKDIYLDHYGAYVRQNSLVRRNKSLIYENEKIMASTFLIGFCGELYMGMKIEFNNYSKPPKYIYNVKEVVENFEDQIKKQKGYVVKGVLEQYKEQVENPKIKALFLKYKTPCFVIKRTFHNYEFEINPCLKDYQFYKVMPPYQAYQELRMFIENDLAHDVNVEIPVGDDVVLAQSKGYDKFSFRRDKQK